MNATTDKTPAEQAFDHEFRFKIGDRVQPKGIDRPKQRRFSDGLKEMAYMISERNLQQCPGGIQKQYRCTAVETTTGMVDERRFNFLEHEVEAFKERKHVEVNDERG